MDPKKVINHNIDEMMKLENEYQQLKKENHFKKKKIQNSMSVKAARFNDNRDKRASHFDFIRNK
ncbi:MULTISPECIES: hypothetical protein [Sporosarcina]|uniref:Uncharacterized protein n=1 Tax=Sporosarcina newyorkensis TaxID=759851 RepID=A0A1T4XDN1_9BACL|nr:MULTISPECIES: hypothetical protein [Sporosarcina]MBY0222740.1 hypothetical protein [Sporosarcina aquimarina]SKA87670.1 hypothetical protein SAMN04244570_0545 [Sporosarcina newyorkensis]